jgi:hypothetical protein
MNSDQLIADHIRRLVALFRPLCSDCETMDELAFVASAEERWASAHAVFDRIRPKSLEAGSELGIQYAFEEICAKTLYNLSSFIDDPFDSDAPYWVIPFALQFARSLGIEDKSVLAIVAA